ncbi:hypothetical protein MVEN_00668600 [Mycena venus]|uniref:Uncharacterized protein n=1 Tax=Mycena venus TaxID=2733690 RepID=A0A8H7D901_9AGAR|nr:hypothetical protein MVEN_00668600 [Mycena venus]
MPAVCSKILKRRQFANRWEKWNEGHDTIDRQTTCTFAVESQPAIFSILTSTQVRVYIEHNIRLYSDNPPQGPGPFAYESFAIVMNNYDKSGFVWAYWDFQQQRIIYPPEGGDIATPTSWKVRDHELSDNLAPPGMTLVESKFYDSLVTSAAQRQAKAHQSQQERQLGKRAREEQDEYDLPSVEETRRRAERTNQQYQASKGKGNADHPRKKARSNESSTAGNAVDGPSVLSPVSQLASQASRLEIENGAPSVEGDADADGEDDEMPVDQAKED